MTPKSNPLFEKNKTPFNTVPFHLIEADHIENVFKVTLRQARKKLKRIIRNDENPDFENTIVPLERIVNELSEIGLLVYNLNSACTSKEIQKVSLKISPKLTVFLARLYSNRALFERINYLNRNMKILSLSNEEEWLIAATLKNMVRHGANMGFLKKIRFVHIQKRLSKLTLVFNDNVLAETHNYFLHITQEHELKGLSKYDIEAAAESAREKNLGGWVFTLSYPSYSAFMKRAAHRGLREKMYRAYLSRCNRKNKNSNRRLMIKIVNLRLAHARLAGYKNYARFVLDERMVKTPEAVSGFLDELFHSSHKKAIAELNELKQRAKDLDNFEEFMPWDYSYYAEKLKNEILGFDDNIVKSYFRLENVVDAVFGLSGQLFGIQFKPNNKIPIYHHEVKTYEVYDENGRFLAVLYLDLFPRNNKQSGAWMTEYKQQSNMYGEMIRPHISVCCNFSRPGSSSPSLLSFHEVDTLLHEFGHALHGILSNTNYPSVSGTNVYRDFVELPSQLMENWLYEHEWLQQFAIHYQNGEAIPAELVEKLTQSRNFHAGYQTQRQLMFAYLDMAWHSVESPFHGNIDEFEKENTRKTQLLPLLSGSNISVSFSHIFGGGYAAGYYSYKWGEMLDADTFSLFRQHGIFDKETAYKYRNEILEKGGSAHPSQLFESFRGRKPSIEALLERSRFNGK